MKSLHCVYNKDRFADQYTIDLEGFVNIQTSIEGERIFLIDLTRAFLLYVLLDEPS